MTKHKVTTREEWLAIRGELLAKEKELTRRGDKLAAERRELPWVPIEKEDTFATDGGPKTLRDLFGGRSQLLVYHFMFGPAYAAGCPVCSSAADTFNGAVPHLNARDVTNAPIGAGSLTWANAAWAALCYSSCYHRPPGKRSWPADTRACPAKIIQPPGGARQRAHWPGRDHGHVATGTPGGQGSRSTPSRGQQPGNWLTRRV